MSRLRKIFLKTGHIYVSKRGYISIEVYSSDRMVCDYVARMLGGVPKPHMRIHKVGIHNRPALVCASRKLLEVVYDDVAEEQLRLVLEYATSKKRHERDNIVKELRELLKEEKNDDNP